MGEKSVNFGIMLIKVLVAAFRSDLDARLWRNVRLLLHLFASLLPLGIIESASLRSILLSFAAVLEEPGVTAVRGDRAAICIIETMCRAGRDLAGVKGEATGVPELDELVSRVQRYATEYRHVEVDLVRAVALKAPQEAAEEDFLHEESLDTAVQALIALKARNYRRPSFLPSPLDLLPPPIVALAKGTIDPECIIILPDILVPPDDEFAGGQAKYGIGAATDADNHARPRSQRRDRKSADTEGWYRAGVGIERGPRYAKWFKDTVPLPSSPAGVIMRSIFYDIIDLYQVNRKECARILFDSARWLRKGTFVCKSTLPENGIFGEVDDQWQIAEDGQVEGGWNLDETIVESILSTALVLPTPPQKPLYYTTLLREVVTLNPQSVAPAMGKSVRRLYNIMNSGRVDGETIRRFAEWFSVHLSNFNFNWNWKEWIPDMTLPLSSPKMAFARRIVELEVRLAYYDRIKTTLPEEVQIRLLPSEEPAPSFTYGTDDHPLRERALLLIQSLRARATAEVILAELESFKKDISPEMNASFVPSTDEPSGSVKVASAEQAEIVVRDVLMQAVLSLGSRSFSHLLNVLEKYHPLLRQMTTSPQMRLVVLSSTARFWSKSPQWIQICVDKLLQYRLVEPTDVVKFVFSPPLNMPSLVLQGSEENDTMRDWSGFNWWELIKLTVNKVNGRVDQVQKRLDTLEREESDKIEKQRAAEEAGDSIEEAKPVLIQEPNKQPLFPSGVTTSTLPRRPDLPPLPGQMGMSIAAPSALTEEEKKGKAQTVEETRVLFTNVVNEQRRVLIDALQGFVTLLQAQDDGSSAWKREGQQDNDDAHWQLWWLVAWYREYCRLVGRAFRLEMLVLIYVLPPVPQVYCCQPGNDQCKRFCNQRSEQHPVRDFRQRLSDVQRVNGM